MTYYHIRFLHCKSGSYVHSGERRALACGDPAIGLLLKQQTAECNAVSSVIQLHTSTCLSLRIIPADAQNAEAHQLALSERIPLVAGLPA